METKNTNAVAADLREMMNGWNKIVAAAKSQYPNASDEAIYQIAKGAMNHALGIK